MLGMWKLWTLKWHCRHGERCYWDRNSKSIRIMTVCNICLHKNHPLNVFYACVSFWQILTSKRLNMCPDHTMLFFLWDGAEVNVLLAIHTLAVCTSRCSKKNSGTYARAVRSSHASMARLYSYPRKTSTNWIVVSDNGVPRDLIQWSLSCHSYPCIGGGDDASHDMCNTYQWCILMARRLQRYTLTHSTKQPVSMDITSQSLTSQTLVSTTL